MGWEVVAIPDHNHPSNEATLARATQHDLTPLDVPKSPPCLAGTSPPAIEVGLYPPPPPPCIGGGGRHVRSGAAEFAKTDAPCPRQ